MQIALSFERGGRDGHYVWRMNEYQFWHFDNCSKAVLMAHGQGGRKQGSAISASFDTSCMIGPLLVKRREMTVAHIEHRCRLPGVSDRATTLLLEKLSSGHTPTSGSSRP